MSLVWSTYGALGYNMLRMLLTVHLVARYYVCYLRRTLLQHVTYATYGALDCSVWSWIV